ncbi:MAG: aldehyde dehydrogenase family protein, partial [Parvularculaceae bacterium]
AAARRAFEEFAATSREERVALLERIVQAYVARLPDLAAAICEEMGAPMTLAMQAQAPSGLVHFQTNLEALKTYAFEESRDGFDIVKEPVGVCGMITPWNWPANQIACKVAPALAAGCTMVLKPSEVAPASGHIIAEILDAAGVPKGVFNLVDGLGPEVGAAIAAHPGVDMVSFTGSTRAGVDVARNAAPTVKRVAQELGGKSANIILDDADLEAAVTNGVETMMSNTGQSCNAPSRMLVPAAKMEKAMAIAAAVAGAVKVGDPKSAETQMGPLSSAAQWKKVQGLIEKGVAEGARLAAGGPGKPEGLERGYYAKPTIFGGVTNDMTIAREEVFGPVLVIIPYKDEDDAVAIANDTPYGLSGYVYSGDLAHAKKIGKRLRAGNVHLNGAGVNFNAPFGGYKQSGNGREWGEFGLDDFLETKAVMRPAG